MPPNVMLFIDDDLVPEKERTHKETGLVFWIGPIDLKTQEALLKSAREGEAKPGEYDGTLHNRLIVDKAVRRWKGVGMAGQTAECNSANKMKFGARFASIADWIYAQATSPMLFAEEVEQAKND